MIEVRDLKKTYGEVEALKDVSFSVQSGEVIGLLGPNGAGKTTVMKILSGYLHPTSGIAEVAGLDVSRFPGEVQEMIGYLPENAPLYPELTVQGQLRMIANLRAIPENEQLQYASDAVHAVGLEDRLVRPIATLSKGYRQRVGLAQAIIHRPKLLILDEPTNGLDPTQIIEVRNLIRSLAHKATVIVSTHILSEVEATCDRAIIIMNGEVKADARLAELSASSSALVSFADNPKNDEIRQALAAISQVSSVQITDTQEKTTTFRVEAQSSDNLCPQIYDLARANDWALCELKRETRTLEAVFNKLTVGQGGVQ